MSVDTTPPPARETATRWASGPQSTRRPVRLDSTQRDALAAPLNPDRVAFDPEGRAHVEGWDVRATLTKIFGFGMWSEELVRLEMVGPPRQVNDKWAVTYVAIVRLTCWDPEGNVLGPWDGTSAETGTLRNLGAAIELAVKASATVALKRAAINLGNQFGLSLYRKIPDGATDRRPRVVAVGSTLQPEPAAVVPIEPSVADPGLDTTTPTPAATPAEDHQAADAPPASAPARPRVGRRPEDVVPKAPPAPVDDDALELARTELRDFALSVGIDPDKFDAAVVHACGVPLNEASLDQVRQIRATIESRYRRG